VKAAVAVVAAVAAAVIVQNAKAVPIPTLMPKRHSKKPGMAIMERNSQLK
jgi:hypothetical protein